MNYLVISDIPIIEINIEMHGLKINIDLYEDIKNNGLLNFVILNQIKPNSYDIIDGKQRVAILKKLNKHTIPAKVLQYTEEQIKEFEPLASVKRTRCTRKELGKMVMLLLSSGYTVEQLSKELGRPINTIKDWIKEAKENNG